MKLHTLATANNKRSFIPVQKSFVGVSHSVCYCANYVTEFIELLEKLDKCGEIIGTKICTGFQRLTINNTEID